MSLTPIEILRQKVHDLERRRRLVISLQRLSLGLVGIIILLFGLGVIEMIFRFSFFGRFLLLLILLAGMVSLAFWLLHSFRLLKSDARHVAHYAEDHLPDLEQRLLTSMEVDEKKETGYSPQLVQRLWQDTTDQLKDHDIQKVTPTRSLWSTAFAALLMFFFLILAQWNSSEFRLASFRIFRPFDTINENPGLAARLSVEPGDIRIERGEDLVLTAFIENILPEKVILHLRTAKSKWNPVLMIKEGVENRYMHYLMSVKEDLSYYVDIGSIRSRHYKVSVTDFPRVERIDVEYIYPEYTGLKNRIEENGGDIIAPEGTEIILYAIANKPLNWAALRFDNGSSLDLEVEGLTAKGSFVVKKDATYSVALLDNEQAENNSPAEYFINVIPDSPPRITVTMPGRDKRVMPLEEITISALAEDDYGLANVTLNYSVSGGENEETNFLEKMNQQQNRIFNGRSTIFLEDLGVKPGDFITYYISATDNNGLYVPSETLSDIYFLEVVSTEEAFQRASAQTQAGMGNQQGSWQQSNALSENQKDIIAATWKLIQRKETAGQERLSEDIEIVADSQRSVLERAGMSLSRLSERLTFSDESYDEAVIQMRQAVEQMKIAAEKLDHKELKEALGPEQVALSAILKAESKSRIKQVMMARNQGGSLGGAQNQHERLDLQDLFEMEMGRLENRYEMPQQIAAAQQNKEDDILSRLRELARRQERLNRSQRDLASQFKRMTEEQKKRRLEELRREQELLSRQTVELSRRMSKLNRQSDQQQIPFDTKHMDHAARNMRETSRNFSHQSPDMTGTNGQEALKNLRDQEQEISRRRKASIADLMKELNRKSWEIREREKQILQNIQELNKKMDGEELYDRFRSSEKGRGIAEDKQKLRQNLTETEQLLRTLSVKGRQDRPEAADKAVDILRSLRIENIDEKIEKSRMILDKGQLHLALELEKKINESIDKTSLRLQDLEQSNLPSRQERIREAALKAGNLRRQLEELQRQMENFGPVNQQRQSNLSRSGTQQDVMTRGLDQIFRDFEAIQRDARGLLQPWARDEGWFINARSVHRLLTQQEIEDFLNQPDLWNKLLVPVQELESKLRMEAEVNQSEKMLYSATDEKIPVTYRYLIEKYYKDLSHVPE